jgi:transposase-like protein
MEIERIDTRKLEPAAREQLRKSALRMHKRGRSQESIARELGLRRPIIFGWVAKAKSGGGTQEGRRGRPLGQGRTLTAEQEERIQKDIVDKTPDQMRLAFALWHANAVRAYIKQSFLIDCNGPAVPSVISWRRWSCSFHFGRRVRSMMTKSERMRCVAAWLRSGQTSMDYAERAGVDADAFMSWILDYGRPSPLIPVRILAGSGEPRVPTGDVEVVSWPPGLGLVSSSAEQRWIPVVIQERS